MQPQNPAGQDAGDLVEPIGGTHVRRLRRVIGERGFDPGVRVVEAQRHRALPSEMLTRP
jgi:hypothetical protein